TGIREIRSAAPGKSFGSLSAAENPLTGQIFILYTEGSAMYLMAVKPDGSPVQAPLLMQNGASDPHATGNTVFAPSGGMSFWGDVSALHYRMYVPEGAVRSPSRSIPGFADATSIHADAAYDLRNDRFLAVWT